MIFAAIYDDDGEITGLAYSNGQADFALAGQRFIEISLEEMNQVKQSGGSYIVDGRVVARPPIPGRYYDWNARTKVWEFNELKAKLTEADEARTARNALLANSDWTDTLSAKSRLGDDLYNGWQSYRQALRDISKQVGFPINIDWPQPPV